MIRTHIAATGSCYAPPQSDLRVCNLTTAQYICWADELIYFWLRCGLNQTLGGWRGGGRQFFNLHHWNTAELLGDVFSCNSCLSPPPGSWASADVPLPSQVLKRKRQPDRFPSWQPFRSTSPFRIHLRPQPRLSVLLRLLSDSWNCSRQHGNPAKEVGVMLTTALSASHCFWHKAS